MVCRADADGSWQGDDAMNQVQSTSFASGTQFSQSIRNRITKIATTTSNGVPQEFADAFEWAADWAGKNGMTLPPDTNEFRSLRNWFCYKLNQFKKGTLGARNEALLAMHGLDFSTYEALNTGKGEREPDAPYILQLRDWRTARGTYDLDASAPVKLRQWQSKLITRYSEDGPSMRIKEMQRKLPDLHFGLWRRPSDQVPSLETRQWWQQATRFEVLTESCHAFRGELHPKTPADLVTWATAQQEKAKAGVSAHCLGPCWRSVWSCVGPPIMRSTRNSRWRRLSHSKFDCTLAVRALQSTLETSRET